MKQLHPTARVALARTGRTEAEARAEVARMAAAGIGAGADGPWESRRATVRQAVRDGVLTYPVVDAWVNQTYSVQLLQHPEHPGIDHLLVRRHDGQPDIGWADLQKIKDSRLDDGQFRWAYEVYPPRLAIVDNANLRHVWVLPRGAGTAPPQWMVDLGQVAT